MSSTDPTPVEPQRLGFRPLYQQVRDMFVQRLVDGVWSPGQILPSEMDLAAETGVSQGTVRKALDAMASEKLVVRRQGRGTFVAEHDEARILFQFFKLVSDQGETRFPDSRILGVESGIADPAEVEALGFAQEMPVWRIQRVRSLAGRPMIVETVVLPQSLFPDLVASDVPNNLYALYASRYGIPVARAQERLKAIALPAQDAAHLGVEPGHPALLIDRRALALDGTTVEWRVSRCLTDDVHYLSDLK